VAGAASGQNGSGDDPAPRLIGIGESERCLLVVNSEEGGMMSMTTGDTYRCSNDECGCKIEVVRGNDPRISATHPPRCCCGMPMHRVVKVRAAA
jgi:hypothetical protein